MAAHYRVATENAALGQPEVKLGIFPAYGGMQRLPRLVGPRPALALAVNGEPVGAWEALRLGLVDEVAPSATALAAAYRAAEAFAEGRRPAPRRDWDALAAAQRADLEALLAEPGVRALAAAPRPAGRDAADLGAARACAAGYAVRTLESATGLVSRKGCATTRSSSGRRWPPRPGRSGSGASWPRIPPRPRS